MMKALLLVTGTVLAFTAGQAAAEMRSVYTDLVLDQCLMDPENPNAETDDASWWCAGYDGIAVRVHEGDLRFFVSYGDDAENEYARSETLPAFNTIGEKLEWRIDNGRAVATILRFHADTGDGNTTRSYLVVTKLGGPGDICQMARVDAVANSNANEIARRIADEEAASFRCGSDEIMQE
jgi:hypothetical protein